MNSLESKRLEYEALREFIGLVYVEGSLARRVKLAVAEELTERQRELIYLYYIEEKTMTEIAESLGLCPSTVSRTLKRGRTRLRKYIKYNGRYIADAVSD